MTVSHFIDRFIVRMYPQKRATMNCNDSMLDQSVEKSKSPFFN